MQIYYGSNVIVNQPKIITDGFYKDFGYGFYCTNFEKQAKRWALTKKNKHVVNVYSYTENKNLNFPYLKSENKYSNNTYISKNNNIIDNNIEIINKNISVIKKKRTNTHQDLLADNNVRVIQDNPISNEAYVASGGGNYNVNNINQSND